MINDMIADFKAILKNNELIQSEPDQGTENSFTIDVRKSTGYELAINETNSDGSQYVFNRHEAFDSNLTDATGDDTLKQFFGKSAKIVAIKKGTATDLSKHKYVIGKKLSQEKTDLAKLRLSTAESDIQRLKNAGYTITRKVTVSEGFSKSSTGNIVYNQGVESVKATKSGITYEFKFVGVESARVEDTVEILKQEVDDFIGTFEGTFSDDISKVSEVNYVTTNDSLMIDLDASSYRDFKMVNVNYNNLNNLKLFLETNKERFDISKSEINSNKDLQIKVYQYGIKIPEGLVKTITLKNIDKLDEELIIDMPKKTDIDGHWAEYEIKNAMIKGYIDASEKFRPKDSITRAEFSKILCKIFEIDTSDSAIKNLDEPFLDVKKTDWYYRYIVALYNYKSNNTSIGYDGQPTGEKIGSGVVINGYNEDVFNPKSNITRQEAAKMIASAYELSTLTSTTGSILNVKYDNKLDKENGFLPGDINLNVDGKIENVKGTISQALHRNIKTKFIDDKEISDWADESVAVLSKGAEKIELDIIGGNPDGTFKPKSNISRAEAVAMLMRFTY